MVVDGESGDERALAEHDFAEPIRVEVGAPPTGPGGPGEPGEDNPWDGSSGENREDELGPNFDVPALEPAGA